MDTFADLMLTYGLDMKSILSSNIEFKTSVLQYFVSAGEDEKVAIMENSGMPLDYEILRALLQYYAKKKDADKMCQALEILESNNLPLSENVLLTTLYVCQNLEHWDKAAEIVGKLKDHAPKPWHTNTYRQVLRYYAYVIQSQITNIHHSKFNKTQSFKDLLSDIIERRPEGSSYIWTECLHFFAHSGSSKDMDSVLQRMVKLKVPLTNTRTYEKMLTLFVRTAQRGFAVAKYVPELLYKT